jgi:phage N-6-adenine-methyltransferase
MFSSKTDLWYTPQDFYDGLHAEFNFTLDPCSNGENAKCATFFTIEDDGLAQEWAPHTVFMNPPPYGREIGDWMRKAYEESLKGATVVCLVPARTDTRWFHDYVNGVADEVRFVKGRLKFGGSKDSAPFPSMVVVYRGKGSSE